MWFNGEHYAMLWNDALQFPPLKLYDFPKMCKPKTITEIWGVIYLKPINLLINGFLYIRLCDLIFGRKGQVGIQIVTSPVFS
jgi:hypothetical protein